MSEMIVYYDTRHCEKCDISFGVEIGYVDTSCILCGGKTEIEEGESFERKELRNANP